MTEPVPGQTPEPAAADGATTTPPPAREPEPEPEPAERVAAEPRTAEADSAQPDAAPDAAAPAAGSPAAGSPAAESPAAGGPGPAAVNPQELFGSLSLSAIEADIDRLMSDKMSQLDGMLAGLEDLVQRLEGEITNLETPPDEPHAPRG